MLAQLAQRSTSATTSSTKATTPSLQTNNSNSDGMSLFLGDGGKDDATAVSDGWVVGTPTPPTPTPEVNGGRLTLGLSSASSGSLGGSTSLSGMTTSASSSSSSLRLARPCSSLSLADLGDLRGDQEGADGCCGGVFLVGGEDCDGAGIGLDLYDLGQEVRAQACFCVAYCFCHLLCCRGDQPH